MFRAREGRGVTWLWFRVSLVSFWSKCQNRFCTVKMGTIIIYYYSEVNTESEIHFDTNDFDTFDTVSEMSFEWIK